jgi:hypothetical protein
MLRSGPRVGPCSDWNRFISSITFSDARLRRVDSGRDELGDRLPVPGNGNRFAAFDSDEKLREVRLCLIGTDRSFHNEALQPLPFS